MVPQACLPCLQLFPCLPPPHKPFLCCIVYVWLLEMFLRIIFIQESNRKPCRHKIHYNYFELHCNLLIRKKKSRYPDQRWGVSFLNRGENDFCPGGLRAPCIAWPWFLPSFRLFFPLSFAFQPLRGNSRVQKLVSSNILALLEDMCKKDIYIFLQKKLIFERFFRLFTASVRFFPLY